MKIFDWKNPAWRKRFWIVLTVLVVLLFASHPELRLILPLLDAIGLDMFFALLGIQFISLFSDNVKPLLIILWEYTARAVRALGRGLCKIHLFRGISDFLRYGVFHWLGWLGPQLWLWSNKLVLGPN